MAVTSAMALSIMAARGAWKRNPAVQPEGVRAPILGARGWSPGVRRRGRGAPAQAGTPTPSPQTLGSGPIREREGLRPRRGRQALAAAPCPGAVEAEGHPLGRCAGGGEFVPSFTKSEGPVLVTGERMLGQPAQPISGKALRPADHSFTWTERSERMAPGGRAAPRSPHPPLSRIYSRTRVRTSGRQGASSKRVPKGLSAARKGVSSFAPRTDVLSRSERRLFGKLFRAVPYGWDTE